MSGPWDEYQAPAGGSAAPWESFGGSTEKPKGRGAIRQLADLGLSVAKGVVAVPEAAVGVADLVTGGQAGKVVERAGVRFKDAKDVLTGLQSDELKAKQQEFSDAEGVIDKAGVALTNPSLIANTVAESVPLMGAGAVPARALLAAAPRVGAAVAGAAGEGAVGAGSAAEAVRQQTDDGLLTGKQTALTAASGAATAGFGAIGGLAARRLGLGDVDTMLAQGGRQVVGGAVKPKGVIRRIAEGAAAEGVLEELPQSLSEQALQNVALDKPITEGLADAAVMGTLAGSVMGGAAGAAGRATPATAPEQAPVQPAPAPEPLGLPSPTITVGPTGEALTADQRMARRPMPGEVVDVTPRPVQTPAEKMGLNPAAGPMSATATVAVNSGLSQGMAEASAAQAAAEEAKKPKPKEETEGTFKTSDEARKYISGQKRAGGASIQALPLPKKDGSYGIAIKGTPDYEIAAFADKQETLRKAGVLDGDVLTKAGEIFPPKQRGLAAITAKRQGAGFEVAPVAGGFVVRKSPANKAEAPATRAPAAIEKVATPVSKPAGKADAPTTKAVENQPQAPAAKASEVTPEQVYQQALAKIQAEYEADPNAIRRDAAKGKAKKTYEAALKTQPKQPPAQSKPAQTAIENVAGSAPLSAKDYLATASQAKSAAVEAGKSAPKETIIPADDKSIGTNTDGDQLYERKDGSVYAMRDGKPSFGGDLAVANNPKTNVQDTPVRPRGGTEAQAEAQADQAGAPAGGEPEGPAAAGTPARAATVEADGVDTIDAAAHAAATSPQNDLPEPTQAQKEAGNYQKGHITVQGLDISIENPKGSQRTGVDPGGKAWSHTMSDHYGYIKRTTGADDEQIDVYVGPKPESTKVFVIDQLDQKTGKFDEHKVMLGFNNQMQAIKAYRANFDKGWKVGPVKAMSMDEFKTWLKDGDTQAPAAMDSIATTAKRPPPPDAQFDEFVSQKLANMMTVSYAGQSYPVASIEDAQAKWDQVRDAALKNGEGSSGMAGPVVVKDADGKELGTISYNGRYWPKEAPALETPAQTATKSIAQPLPNATAPEQVSTGVDDRELDQIVEEFNEAQASMVNGDEKVTHVFDPPAKNEIVRLADKVKVYHKDKGWMTVAEAKASIAEWKAKAQAQGEDAAANGNANRVVLSLFDLTGSWSKPWEEAGYQVYRFDIQSDPDMGDVNKFDTEFFQENFGDFDGNEVYAILAACPCTDFAVSGARHFAAKDKDGRTVASVKLVHQALATIEYFKPAVWSLENPVGRIEKLGGLPPWRLSFDPNHLGDPYTKKTIIWGRFNGDLPIAPVEPTEGSKMHKLYGGKSMATKNARSETPEGFSYGFFLANNAVDHPVMAIAHKYDRLDRKLIEKAVAAGITEAQISEAVDDFYYMDLDDAAANEAIQGLIDQPPPAAQQNEPEAKAGRAKAATKRVAKQEAKPGKIEDFGEKIGGARKDTAVSTGKTSKPKSTDERPAWKRRFQISQIVSTSGEREGGRWVIRDTRSLDWTKQPRQVGRQTFATEADAEAAVPLYAVALKHSAVPVNTPDGQKYEIWREITDRKRVKVLDKQFDTRDQAMEYMARNAEQIIETNTTFGEADLPVPENKQRIGAARRQGDVTGEDIQKAFGFRGVEFGNWNNQVERQEIMNEAYDGLLDLAEVMNIPPKAISMNGELALAFGARGHGLSGARAHYEPDHAVINLTKMKGAGALAHEWFHALDHYFGRKDGKASSVWVTKADGTRVLKANPSFEEDAATGGFSRRDSGVRAEVQAAYLKVMTTITKKGEQYVEDTARVDRFVAAVRDDVEKQLVSLRRDLAEQKDPKYWKRNNKPATADQLAQFDALAKKILDGEALDTELRPATGNKTITGMRWTNDGLEQLSTIYKAVRGRSGFDGTKRDGILDRLRQHMGLYSARLKMLADAQTGQEKTKQVPTDFAMDAKSLDQGRGTNYWTTPHEMAARAFQGYVEDKIAAGNGRSPFLNYGPEKAGILTPWGWKRPYPAGEERKAINAALDELVATIETVDTEQGVALQAIWRSALQDGISTLTTNAAPAMGWQAAIKGMVNKGTVKADEVEWSGITDWLQLQTGKITKAQVLDYLDSNGVQVQETMLGGKQNLSAIETLIAQADAEGFTVDRDALNDSDNPQVVMIERETDAPYRWSGKDLYDTSYQNGVIMAGPVFDIARQLGDIADAAQDGESEDGTRYSDYQLPGGQNYRELLLTLPTNEPVATRQQYSMFDENNEIVGQGMWPASARTQELIDEHPEWRIEVKTVPDKSAAKREGLYQSGHWDQSNILAHVRFNERTDADGKKVLFIEEIQSDWAQEGKRVGFAGNRPADKDALPPGTKMNEYENTVGKFYQVIGVNGGGIGDGMKTRQAAVDSAWEYRDRQMAPRAPFVGKTDAWVSLAVKRMVSYAAANGFDRVAFVNGEQSADRYDLSKQIESIAWDDLGTGKFVTLTPNDKNYLEFRVKADGTVADARGSGGSQFNGQQLEAVVGKDIAAKMMASEKGKLAGDGLKVGGEGMKAFYDKIVPAVAKDVLKKLGGGSLQTVTINKDDIGLSGKVYKDGKSDQTGFDITPAMREKAVEGLPMFANTMDAAAFAANFGPAKGMTVEATKKVVDRIGAKWKNGPRIIVVGTTADLPDNVRARVGKGARGVYTRDAVFVIAKNNTSADWVARTLAHEVIAHEGLRGLLGQEGHAKMMQRIQKGADQGVPLLVASRDYVRRAYAGQNLTKKQEADEIAAHVVEMAVDPVTGEFKPGFGWLKMVFAKIRQFLRDLGFDVNFTHLDLQGMLVASMRNLEAGQKTQGGGELVVAAARDGQPMQAAGVPARSRPRGTVTFDKAITGPSGAKLTAYTWQWKPLESIDERGEERVKRISDWEKAEINPETGREVVHQFVVDGRVVSLESAANMLGHGSTAPLRSTASTVKTLARLQMQLAEVQSTMEQRAADQAEVDKLPLPEITGPDDKKWFHMGDAMVRQPFEPGPITAERRRLLVESWRDNRMADKEWTLGSSPGIMQSKERDLQDRIKRAERKIGASMKVAREEASSNDADILMALGEPSGADRLADMLKATTVTDVKRAAGNKLADYRGLGLQFLGGRQINDLYADDIPQLPEYTRMVQQMSADANEVGANADTIATNWGKLADERQLAELMHDATLAQIDPAKDFVKGDNRIKWAQLNAQYKALSPEAQNVYRMARNGYEEHYAEVRQAIREKIQRSDMAQPAKAAMLERMDGEFFEKIKGVYFPLSRFGKYVVVTKGPDGKAVSVSRAETLNEAEALRTQMRKDFPADKGYAVGKVIKDKEFNAARDSVGRGFLKELFGVLDQEGVGEELQDAVNQLYLASMPDLSWAKHGIHRKGTPGFSQDARRAYAQNMFHGARYLAKLRYADQLQEKLVQMQKYVEAQANNQSYDSVKGQQIVDEVTKRNDSLMNPKGNPLSTALTSFGFVFHLGLSPASAMVNLSQTALVAYPIMGAKWGFDKAAAALAVAGKQAATNKNDISAVLDGDELRAYDEAVRAGTIDVTNAHDLAGIAQGEDAKVSWKLRPVMKWASFLFHHAERFNRQITFVASYRLAREAGANHGTAFEQATKATYDGHFDYSASNRPRVMQGNAAKVLLLFKQYGQNMVYTLARQAQQAMQAETPEGRAEARKALGGLLAMHAAAAGGLGLPMVSTLLAAASMLGGSDDEPWDAETALRNMLADAFGQKPAEVMARGFSRLTPWDISGRVGLDKLILPDLQEGLEGQRLGEAAMAAALGPVAGIGINVLKGMQEIGSGQFARGIETMMPAALRGPVKALRYAEEGAQDKTGVVIKDQVSAGGIAGQALGFSPSEVRNATEGRGAIYQADQRLLQRRKELMDGYARAYMKQDVDGVAEARNEIAAFNEKNPGRRINGLQLVQSVRRRQARIDQAQEGVYLPKNRRDALAAGQFAATE